MEILKYIKVSESSIYNIKEYFAGISQQYQQLTLPISHGYSPLQNIVT